MAGLANFRMQHPEYSDMPDGPLADKLYQKFYSDMPRDQFDAKMGTAPQASPKAGGLANNFAAGTVEGVTGGLAGLSDPGAGDELGALGLSPHVPMGTPAQGAQAMNAGLGKIGLNPEMVSTNSGMESLMRTGGQLLPAAFGGEGGIISRMARVAVPAATSEGAGQLTRGTPFEQPARVLGALAGGGMTAAGENMLSTGAGGARALFGGGGPTPAAQAAHEAGFVIPPGEASEKPGAISSMLGGIAGKIKMQQQASTANAQRVNALAAQAVGLPADQPVTASALEGVRHEAGQAYEAVRRAPVEIIPDAAFRGAIASLHNVGSAARAEIPELVGNPELENLASVLSSKERLSPDAAVDLVRSLRYKAQTNLKNYTSPEKMDLGRAQSKAANAVETLIERNLEAATTARGPIGAQGGDMSALVDNLQQARQTIAKTYDVEGALNQATGHIDAMKFAKLAAKGKPQTDELAQIGQSAANFPKNFQDPSKFGRTEKVSKLDVAAGVMTHGASLPLSFAGPTVRSALLSAPYQKLILGSPGLGASGAPFGMPSISAAALAKLLQSPTNEAN